MNQKKYSKNSGFSFLELLMVMAIMSLMFTFTLISYQGVQKSGRDTQRRNDLKQYQTLLETFANNTGGFYPGRSSAIAASDAVASPSLCSDLSSADCPPDPKDQQPSCQGNTCVYEYISNGSCDDGTACATQFVLYTYLEKTQEYFVVCSSGVSGELDDSVSISSGACPLP